MSAGPRLAAWAQARLSPRQQQAVRLLLLPSTDYAQLLRQAACDNPFLEWAEEGWAEPGAEAQTGGLEGAEGLAREALDDAPWGEEAPGWGGAAGGEVGEGGEGGEGVSGKEAAAARLASPVTLAEHLSAQLGLLRLPARERLLAQALAACLEEDGYLRLPLAEVGAALAEAQPAPRPQELALALARVQSLEPAGVGARDLAECLALQLGPGLPGGPADPIRALALTLVREHLPALAARDLAGLARRLGQPLDRVQAACDCIRHLDPRPGLRLAAPAEGAVTPDVVVRRHQGQWVAHLNPAALPRLRLQRTYADWYAGHRAQGGAVLGRHLQEARWTLRNVEQRFATILAVARAILQRQHRFLALGPMALRPLALREIAQAVGVHESTVSRVTHQKYMATPCGLFELRFFFSRGLATDSGGHCSPTAVRGLIRALVEAEPPGAPLSDVDLARALAAQGLQVARRTVTKYRQQLRIEAAPRRGPAIR